VAGLLLGCIADDSTGATDLANNLVRGGMRVVQTIGVPAAPLEDDVDAVVVALKSRTCPAKDAVASPPPPTRGCAARARSRSTSSTARPSTRRRAATSGR
jgi:3-dehydrotetronate 4-kinase